jgi:hypothetical protein
MNGRAPDPARVRTREIEFSDDQHELVETLLATIREVCQTPEEAAALLVYALSEFLLRIAKPDTIPEAVATAIECLRQNTGQT